MGTFMNQKALNVLQRLTANKPSKQWRGLDLLKPAEAEYAEGWYMCVPKCFNTPLDIQLTERIAKRHSSLVWTQGSAFSFSEGHTLYDTPGAYQVWGEALKIISLCVQVKQALPAIPASKGKSRAPGSVKFDIFKPNDARTGLDGLGHYSLSQDGFVRFLIVGPEGELASILSKSGAKPYVKGLPA